MTLGFRVAKSLLVSKDILCLDSFIEYYGSLREFLEATR
jgi:hypothetical protein